MTSHLDSCAAFAGDLHGPALPPRVEQLARGIDQLNAQRQRPISRKPRGVAIADRDWCLCNRFAFIEGGPEDARRYS